MSKQKLWLFVVVIASAAGCSAEFGTASEAAGTGEGAQALRFDVGGQVVDLPYEVMDGWVVTQGDMVLGRVEDLLNEDVSSQALRAVPSINLWPGGVIPFAIDGDVPDQSELHEAMAHWMERTSIRFVQRTNEVNYLRIVSTTPGDCRAVVGHYSATRGYDGVHKMWAGKDCTTPTFVHEFGHVVGLWHEQSRNDRDEHVKVFWDNIKADSKSQFHTYNELSAELQASNAGREVGPYDTYSVMHYPSSAFAIDPSQPTLLRLDNSVIAYPLELSVDDIAGVEQLYPAMGGGTTSRATGPFDTVEQFVDQQVSDFYGTVTRNQHQTWVQAVASGDTSPEGLIASFATDEANGARGIIRIYAAMLGRYPDQGGLEYWHGRFRSGLSVRDIARAFTDQPEYKNRFDAVGDAEFVEYLYVNLLGRRSDAGGKDYWIGQVQATSRFDVFMHFIGSEEFVNRYQASVTTLTLYHLMLKRGADREGFDFWANQVATAGAAAPAAAFLASEEYQSRF